MVSAIAAVAVTACEDDDTPNPPPSPPAPLEVLTSVVPDANVGRAYRLELFARGGVPPYEWSAAGTLPEGMMVGSDGALVGTASVAGTFTFEVQVEDADAASARRDLSITVEDQTGPEAPPVIGGICNAPTTLQLMGGAQTLQGRLPATSAATVLCGDVPSEVTAYLTLTLSEPSTVRAAVASTAAVSLTEVGLTCPATAGRCSRFIEATYAAGEHRFAVAGPAGALFSLVVEADAEVVPPGLPTCLAPEVVDLSTGQTILMGSFENGEDQQSGSCSVNGLPEAVYTLELTEAADLIIDPGFSSQVYVRAEDCQSGSELGCFGRDGFFPNLAPGRYFLIIEPIFLSRDSYSVSVSQAPPTLPATNNTCDTAEIFSLDEGSAQLTAVFGNIPADDTTMVCRGSSGLYYRTTLAEPGALEISNPRNADVELFSGTCGQRERLVCSGFDATCSPTLPAGDYFLRVAPDRSNFRGTETVDVRRVSPRPLPPNDFCEDAIAIELGQPITTASIDATDDVGFSTCSPSSRADTFFTVELTERSDLTTVLSGPGVFDHQVVVAVDDCASPTVLSCGGTGSRPRLLYGLSAGTYLVAVERSFSRSEYSCRDRDGSEVTLTVNASPSPPPPENDSCDGASTSSITFSRGVQTIELAEGTLLGATNDFASVECPGGSELASGGPDVVFPLVIPEGGRIEVESDLPGAALSIIPTRCDVDNAIACSRGFGGNIPLTPIPAGTYWLRVDSRVDTTPRDFELTLTLLAP